MSNHGVAAVEKALGLLDCFRLGATTMSLAQLATASGMHKTTVFRLLNSLERMSYVVRTADSRYALGPRLLYLGKLYEQSFQLGTVIEPVLQDLALATKESASYYVLHGDEQRMCLYRAEPSEGLRETRLPGTILPLDDTAIGSVLKYWGKDDASARREEPLPWFTSGFRDIYTAAFATPLFGAGDKFMAALTLSGPASRLEAANRADIARVQLVAAARLSRRLGASALWCEKVYGAAARASD
ncbi:MULTISPECIES: IclR family transcriptional regulator [Cupriavidus]|uniref:IclR family transcriptional regulator n=1 Tax=Cupriavidus pauculus TaxID=82633 RepID=A0A3G8H4T7_9BURK|nr:MULTISPECIES: IclR family transcriptional regulator [Cupriavidus]AZG15543.1 IclR family transcriptional regulator [Cupriavidus pauculus]MDT6961956.1 IclR family transcriptional regulator [Cupriavidus sp. SZY C1]